MDKYIKTYSFNELISLGESINNQQRITIDEIVESLKNIESSERYTVLSRLNEKKYKSVYKKYLSYLETNLNKLKDKTIPIIQQEYYSNELDNLSDILFYDLELSMYECTYFEILYNNLYNISIDMCLPIDDNNPEKQKDKFYNDRLSLAILLRRMGKINESNMLLYETEYSKIYTFQSYSKDWKALQKKELLKDKDFRKFKIDSFLSFIISKVKERLKVKESNKQEMIKLSPQKKHYKRLENFYLLYRTQDKDI